LYRLITVADTKNDLFIFCIGCQRQLITKINFGYRLLIPATTTKNISEPARRQPKISPPARPSLSSHRPPVLVHSIQNLSLSLSTPPAQPPSIAPGQEWRRGATPGIDQPRGSCCTPLFFPIGSIAPPFFSNIGMQREARWRMSEQTTALPSSSPSAVASEGAVACRCEDRGAPLFFPNGISNGAPPFFPNKALLPPLDCTSSLPPASSRFGPVAASFGATWTRCSLACARRRSSLWVQRSLSAPATSSPASPSPT
jgi:hypothetical protein